MSYYTVLYYSYAMLNTPHHIDPKGSAHICVNCIYHVTVCITLNACISLRTPTLYDRQQRSHL